MLLHYLVKVETLKMHVNTTSAFNGNYKIAVKCIKFHYLTAKGLVSVLILGPVRPVRYFIGPLYRGLRLGIKYTLKTRRLVVMLCVELWGTGLRDCVCCVRCIVVFHGHLITHDLYPGVKRTWPRAAQSPDSNTVNRRMECFAAQLMTNITTN